MHAVLATRVGTSFVVPTLTQQRAMRIADLKALAERLGLRWGGIEKGNVVTLYFGEGAYTVKSLPQVEKLLFGWLERDEKGDRAWFGTIEAALTGKLEGYRSKNITMQDLLQALVIHHADLIRI